MITRKPDPTKKLYKTKKWRWISQMVIDREHNICQYCHNPIESTFNIHHIEVATLANFYDMDNLMLLHVECHQLMTRSKKIKRDENELYSVSLTEHGNLVDFDK